MKLTLIFFLVGITILSAQADSVIWKHYGRGGIVIADTSSGGLGYYRINRRSETVFRDLRFFAFGLKNDAFIYIRYKSSDKYKTHSKFYRYTTTSYRKNTRAGVDLQYHFNQGFGVFLKEYKNGLMNLKKYSSGLVNLEIGHAYDMSNYLNETRKTSYVKTAVFWDHDGSAFSTKLELEHFRQISEINVNNLSRNQYVFELIIPLKNSVSLNMIYELENYLENKRGNVSSITFSVGKKGNLKGSAIYKYFMDNSLRILK
jgi:hypothetical protein